MTTYKTINKKTDYFSQRKQVMKYVYEARNIARKYNINHPRIEVRICENEKDCNTNAQVLGVASMDSKTKNIWIMEKAFKYGLINRRLKNDKSIFKPCNGRPSKISTGIIREIV
jgi:hypothetical protein